MISVKELFGVIKRASDEVKAAQKGGIPIVSLNPDTDGDGKVLARSCALAAPEYCSSSTTDARRSVPRCFACLHHGP